MKIYTEFFVLIGILLSCLPAAFAQGDEDKGYYQPLQDVFQTELVYPQEKGEVQLSLNPEFGKGANVNHINFPFVTEYGVTNDWQIGFTWNSFQNNFVGDNSLANGIGDLELETQYSFMNIAKTNFHAALGLEFGIPLGNEENEIGEGFYEFTQYSSFAVDFPSLNNMQLFAQTGISFARNKEESGGEEASELFLSGGLFAPVNKVILDIELSWMTSKWDNGDENQLYLTPGLIFDLPGGWETGIGTSIGLNNESEKFLILGILTFEFNITGEED